MHLNIPSIKGNHNSKVLDSNIQHNRSFSIRELTTVSHDVIGCSERPKQNHPEMYSYKTAHYGTDNQGQQKADLQKSPSLDLLQSFA